MSKSKSAKELIYEISKEYEVKNKDYAYRLISITKGMIINGINYEVIEQVLKEAINVLEEIDDKTYLYTLAIKQLANLYIPLGRYDEAKDLFLIVEDIYNKNNMEKHKSYSDLLYSFALLHCQMNRLEEAECLFNKALMILKFNKMEFKREYAAVLSGLALLYIQIKRYSKAEPLYTQVLEILKFNNLENQRDYAAILYNMAKLYTKMDRFEEANHYYIEAIQIFRQNHIESSRDYGSLLHGYAVLKCKTKNYNEAFEKSLESLNVFNNAIMKVAFGGSSNSGSALKNSTKAALDLLISILVNYSEKIETINNNFIQQIITRRFGDLYVSGLKNILFNSYADEGEKNYHNSLLKMLEDMDHETTLKVVDEGRKSKNKIRESIQMLEAKVLGNISTNASSQINTDKIFQDNEKIVEYVHYKDWFCNERNEGYCAIVYNPYRKEEAQFVFIGSSKDIDNSIHSLRDKILFVPTALENEEYDYLYEKSIQHEIDDVMEKVIKPLGNLIDDTEYITICADGEITKLPFELLMQNKKIRYMTSGIDEKWLGIPVDENMENLVLGSSEFGEYFGGKSEKDRRAGFPMQSLEYVSNECNLVASILKKVQATKLNLNVDFTKSSFLYAKPCNILHIATHGFFFEKYLNLNEQKNETNTNVINNQENIPNYYDIEKEIMIKDDAFERCGLATFNANVALNGYQYAQKVLIYGSNIMKKNLLGTKLVVLSACNTGLGDVKNGDGIYGLQRAFFLSGVKTLIVSLWNVNDKSTCILMKKLYDGIIDGIRVDESLALAKEYIKTATAIELHNEWEKSYDKSPFVDYDDESIPFEHPYFWAGFICIGHGGAIY